MGAAAAQVLVVIGASIIGALGCLHLAYTYFGERLLPRDRAVVDAMKGTTLVLTRETTVWDAWIGFNGSHSLGAILLAAVYLLLATQYMDVLARSKGLMLLAVSAGAAYVWLAYLY